MAISVMTWVWNHSRSRSTRRLVLLAIADCASSEGGQAWPSVAELMRKAGLGERAVQTALADLVELGELAIEHNAGPKGCNRYQVIMTGRGGPPQNMHPRRICTPQNMHPRRICGGQRHRRSAARPPQNLHPPQNMHPRRFAGGPRRICTRNRPRTVTKELSFREFYWRK